MDGYHVQHTAEGFLLTDDAPMTKSECPCEFITIEGIKVVSSFELDGEV